MYNSAWNVKAQGGAEEREDFGKETDQELGGRKEEFRKSAPAREASSGFSPPRPAGSGCGLVSPQRSRRALWGDRDTGASAFKAIEMYCFFVFVLSVRTRFSLTTGRTLSKTALTPRCIFFTIYLLSALNCSLF